MRTTVLAAVCFGIASLAGCGWGSTRTISTPAAPLSTAEIEPNDTVAGATPLPLGTAGIGELLAVAEIDYWSFDAKQDEVICVEVFAIRLDQAGWSDADNTARVRLFGPPNGTTQEIEHRFTDDGWENVWDSRQDYDIVCFRIPASGTYYVCIEPDVATQPGGKYVVRVTKPAGYGNLQDEAEPQGVSGVNDTVATAEAISPGVIHGFYVDGESDFFKFEITQPSTVYFELCASRSGRWRLEPAYFDPYLVLFDTDGTTHLSEHHRGCYEDPLVTFKFTEPGTYYVQVREPPTNEGSAPYFLTYTLTQPTAQLESEQNNTPAAANFIAYGDVISGTNAFGDPDYFRFEGTAGDLVEIIRWDWLHIQGGVDFVFAHLFRSDGVTYANGSGAQTGTVGKYHAVLDETGTYYLQMTSLGAGTQHCFELRRLLGGAHESEPNDQLAQAHDLDANTERSSAGLIEAGDQDVYRFATTPGEFVCVDIWAARSLSFDGFFFNGTLLPRVEIGQLPEWLYQAASLGEARGTKGCDNPTMTCCFIATGTSETVTVSRQFGSPDPMDVYVIRRRQP